ncbi:MAG: hypothetical protein ABSH21_10630 [Verrucomicrobiia bacterium]|jgi:hypothetical protein
MNLHDLIERAAFTWIAHEKANAQSLPGQIGLHVAKAGKLRIPQREAIEIYLWLKFYGQNRALGDIIRGDLLRDQCDQHPALCANPATEFLHQFAKKNDSAKLAATVKDDPLGQQHDWNAFQRRAILPSRISVIASAFKPAR